MFLKEWQQDSLVNNIGRTVNVISKNISFTGTLMGNAFGGFKVVSESKSHDTINTIMFSGDQVVYITLDTDTSLIIRICL